MFTQLRIPEQISQVLARVDVAYVHKFQIFTRSNTTSKRVEKKGILRNSFNLQAQFGTELASSNSFNRVFPLPEYIYTQAVISRPSQHCFQVFRKYIMSWQGATI